MAKQMHNFYQFYAEMTSAKAMQTGTLHQAFSTTPHSMDINFARFVSSLLIELVFKLADDAENVIEGGNFSKEHIAVHFLIVFAPIVQLVRQW